MNNLEANTLLDLIKNVSDRIDLLAKVIEVQNKQISILNMQMQQFTIKK